ncbi:tRNA uridine-5-carboxymethylaminomethyl(34) synthesis GTPase MnmE [Brotomerdimonas butyrica]|nr:tRNA uridine-5-carboxymethylaminomethyl(34) synthesis GTPase MnmE [Brotomerdimonas butyrica]MCU6755734.1 tRNA uridine-5-carboxymethylaminomethyl(34) synthesis GTPase MnmE [Brotomerdimonas butyrica]
MMEDTIAAVATAYGEGGIGIIRISGEKALSILEEVFEFAGETSQIVNRRMTYGRIVDRENEQIIDEVLAVYMKGPKTYTAEDVVEINCHGSMVSLRKTLALVLRKGARLAEPGEFTKRAFLNGRLDLSQAEAVIDIIKAKTDRSFDVAMSQLEGALSLRVTEIRQKLLDLLVDITVNIDYPDEDIEELTYDKIEENILLIGEMIEKLLSTADTGRMIREGIRVAIVGKPNVGKSSLMNSLLRETRAIVTEIPGTTRDTIEEAISIRNIPVYLVDTAGIRETSDEVERLGIERSKAAFNEADFIIFIMDGSSAISDEDREIASYLDGRDSVVLINKNDLERGFTNDDVRELVNDPVIIETSLINNEGIEEIENHIEELVYGGELSQHDSTMVNNVRHIELLKQSRDSLRDAMEMTLAREALDFIEVDVRNAYDLLGEITGETVSDDIINEVFARFCLGK